MGFRWTARKVSGFSKKRILSNYDQMIETDRFVLMDGTVRVNKLQKLMRQLLGDKIDLAHFGPKKK